MNKYLQVVDNLLTPQECQDLINKAESIGFKEVDRGIAIYHQAMITDQTLANKFYHKIKHLLPSHFNGFPIVGLNDHFRFSKYHPRGFFDIHKDGVNQDSKGNRSVMTLNIFLNDNFQGGETDFYYDDKTTLRYSVQPKPGRGALFAAQQYHCGNQVVEGYKYLLRTDVMCGI